MNTPVWSDPVFWSALGDDDRTALEGLARRGGVVADRQLFAQGDPSDDLIVVVRGWIKVVSHSTGGYRALLALRGPGDLLGEQAGIAGHRRTAALHTATEVDLLWFTAERFHAYARDHPAVTRALEQTLSGRLHEADRQRAHIAEPVAGRLAALLLDLAARCGEPGEAPGEIRIALPLSQEDLAGLLLSSLRTVSRVLEQWRAEGLIVTGRRSLRLPAPQRLEGLTAPGR
ncbi:putative transcriptional regulator with cyclic nucleotide-binding domain [Actinacidiphila reveromycinica]|uniref:Putative transcriptional regulator with cyclic nucleotide-binding domain n=1 Tax=Actinacidiphila reveromycinica TaxID=659352 RepID=A0A7U3VLE3_9ACTN|nr:Crp/Fnr family transcriptional regulator [Streptomyces sp. SN-593]BBA95449.1 putative transcriptional regulator with cyclic nucleotide-binding domain [Streptomyces sp. SN-593]